MMNQTLQREEGEALRKFKAEVFRVLAHPTRIHIVETLRGTEMWVGAIQKKVGIEPANLSQHLAILRSKRIVVTRKSGNQVLYRLRDPLLTDVLATMRRFFLAHVEESLSLLQELGPEKKRTSK